MSADDEQAVKMIVLRLQQAMWAYAGLLREESTLREGIAAQNKCETDLLRFVEQGKTGRRLVEANALCRVARAILQAALARTESRGAHFRNDYPAQDDSRFRKHSVLRASGEIEFQEWQVPEA